jgi:integrase
LPPAWAERLALAAEQDPDTPLFTNSRGGRLNDGNERRRVLKPAAAAAGLVEPNPVTGEDEPWVGFHSFRHTFASLLIDEGKNIAVVAAWLGHDNPRVTLDTYAHLMDRGLGGASFLDTLVVSGNTWATQHPDTSTNGRPRPSAEMPK